MSAQNTPMVMVAAAARALCHQHAAICNVNADDLWNLESESLKEDAQKALQNRAPAPIKTKPTPQLIQEVWQREPANADRAWAAVLAACRGVA